MKSNRKLALCAALGLALGGTAFSAHAISITTSTGTFDPFGGFDWASNGTAVITGYNPVIPVGGTSLFTFEYFASVGQASGGSVTKPNGTNLPGATAGAVGLDSYEYTIHAQIQEQATCTAVLAGVCSEANFDVLVGATPNFFNVYYDTTPDADQETGAGFTDGILIIGGTVNNPQSAGSFNGDGLGGNGTGSNSLLGTVSYTNNSYISPNLLGTNFGSQINFGNNVTGWIAPTGTPTDAVECGVSAICVQADGNQIFSASPVPEPGSLALLGIGLLGVVGASRRRK